MGAYDGSTFVCAGNFANVYAYPGHEKIGVLASGRIFLPIRDVLPIGGRKGPLLQSELQPTAKTAADSGDHVAIDLFAAPIFSV